MIALWRPELTFEFFVAVALGNVLAILVHAGTWWLRHRPIARIVIAFLGAAALLLYLGGVGTLIVIFADGGFDFDNLSPPPANWKFKAFLDFLKIASISSGLVSLVGAVQMRQIPERWSIATLCFCFELAFALLAMVIVTEWRLTDWFPDGYNLSQRNALGKVFSLAVLISLLLLAFCRPFFLVVLKYIYCQVIPSRSSTNESNTKEFS